MEKRNIVIIFAFFIALCVLSVMIIYSPNAKNNAITNGVNTVQETVVEEISKESSLPANELKKKQKLQMKVC